MKPKYKIGDRVRIIDNPHYPHEHIMVDVVKHHKRRRKRVKYRLVYEKSKSYFGTYKENEIKRYLLKRYSLSPWKGCSMIVLLNNSYGIMNVPISRLSRLLNKQYNGYVGVWKPKYIKVTLKGFENQTH